VTGHVAPVHPVGVLSGLEATGLDPTVSLGPLAHANPGGSFAKMLMHGLDEVNARQNEAETMVSAFAVDDSIPLHRVMFALQEAQGSIQLLMQVRSKLLEGYQDLMRMQL
jgi:flagellar hook-basal body complex protein FliE